MATIRLRDDTSIWLARFLDADGKKRERSTGTTHRREAQKIADSYEAAAQRKFTVAHVQRTLRELMADASGTVVPGSTVAEYFRALLARRKPEVARATFAYYEMNSRKFLEWASVNLPAGGKTQMAAVTPAHIESYRNFRFERVSATTTNHGMKFIRQVFMAARNDAVLLESPCAAVGRVRRHEPSAVEPFTLDQVRALLAAAAIEPEWRSLILFGLYTGQRLGDLVRLDWKQVDLARGEISFVMAKTGRRMMIPLAIPLVALLAETPVLDRLGPIHPASLAVVQLQGTVGTLSNRFYRLMVRAGIVPSRRNVKSKKGRDGPRVRTTLCFHSFRHTATSMLRDAGAPHAVAMELIGHTSSAVHRHYAHLGADTLRRAVSLLPAL